MRTHLLRSLLLGGLLAAPLSAQIRDDGARMERVADGVYVIIHDNAGNPAQAADLVQEIACRIWRWRLNHQQKSEKMSEGEWNSFAARTAYNEVKRHFSRATRSESLPLESVPEAAQTSIEKQTEIEVALLIEQVWQAICQLTLRQRQSLLLHSQDLIIYFLQIGISDEQFADLLEVVA